MKTSLGYIGQDALQRRREQDAKRGKPAGGPPRRRSGR
jgi:23S rRNA pseudouridine2605 synthase